MPLILALLLASGTPASATQLSRRCVVAGAAGAAAASPLAARAVEKGGVQWTLDIPEQFAVSRQLASLVRVKRETMLQAEDEASGAVIKLLLLPLGQQAGGSLDADEQLKLANVLLGDGGVSEADAAAVATIMTASAKRSPGVASLTRMGGATGASEGGRGYVRYGYALERCTGGELLDDGECLGGSLAKRKTLAAVTISSISQFRTNTERERMRELGQVRNVDVLWLLTLSAPDGPAWASTLEPTFEKVRRSLRVL